VAGITASAATSNAAPTTHNERKKFAARRPMAFKPSNEIEVMTTTAGRRRPTRGNFCQGLGVQMTNQNQSIGDGQLQAGCAACCVRRLEFCGRNRLRGFFHGSDVTAGAGAIPRINGRLGDRSGLVAAAVVRDTAAAQDGARRPPRRTGPRCSPEQLYAQQRAERRLDVEEDPGARGRHMVGCPSSRAGWWWRCRSRPLMASAIQGGGGLRGRRAAAERV